MPTSFIEAYKHNRPIRVQLPFWGEFKRPQVYTRIAASRIVGIDSESFKSSRDKRLHTQLVSLDFVDASHNIVLATGSYEYALCAVLEQVFPLYSVPEEKPSWTKQRPRRARSDGAHRDGRRQHIEPCVFIFYNLEYDLGRLVGLHPAFRRAILLGEDSVRVRIGQYEIEIAWMVPGGNAPHFEWYIRHDHNIMRVLGRDLWGYLKTGLKEAAQQFLSAVEQKLALPQEWFSQYWEDFSEKEVEELRAYSAQDPRATRLVYETVITLLLSIDEHVIGRSGLPPPSAPGAAAKMAFAMASQDTWHRPSRRVSQVGAWSYAGARVFNRRRGYFTNLYVRDVSSMYPHIMTQLADPCTCEYVSVEPQSYNLADWRGKWGSLQISGEGLDEYYPALRMHDSEHGRLRYIYGPFQKVWATIPEIVIGVMSRRLRVEQIHDGILMVGSPEHSFLRHFVLKVYAIKSAAPPGSALYILAKLLMNTLYGKLLEVNIEQHTLPALADYIKLPAVSGIATHIDALLQTYIDGGYDALDDAASNLFETYTQTEDNIPLGELLQKRHPAEGRAGAYYLPMHGAQITGMASAKLGLAAACTQAIQGHTDSLFTLGRCDEGMQEYESIMQACGYDAPSEGLGAFALVIKKARGYLVNGNLYAIKYTQPGARGEQIKMANHGLAKIDKQEVWDAIERMFQTGEVTYTTTASPRKLRSALLHSQEPGEFLREERTLHTVADPNMTWTIAGDRVWKPLTAPPAVGGYRPPPRPPPPGWIPDKKPAGAG